jgi:hypothetical protein
MSTVSLMPVGKKIQAKRSLRVPIASMLSSADNLRKSGNMIGDCYRNQELILDEGTVLRVDAFSAVVKAKGYPATKITVFPDGGKSGTVYVSLDDLDGLSWESIDEAPKKPSAPTRRIDISIKDDSINLINVWHGAFRNRNYEIGKSGTVVVNPLELSDNDLRRMNFTVDTESRIGEAVVKIGRDTWTYQIRYKIHYLFDLLFPDTIELTEGDFVKMKLISAKFNRSIVKLQIQHGFGYGSDKEWQTITETADTPDKFIRSFLEEKHPK